MAEKLKIIALIPAAGRGTRLGGNVPKQYLPLAGKALLRRAVEAFLQHPGIAGVCVVIHPDDQALYEQAMEGLTLLPPALGATRRQDSVRLGLEHIADYAPTHVLIHDAARPYITPALIDRLVAGLIDAKAVIPAIKISDTVKQLTGTVVSSGPARDSLVAAQTPQGFTFAAILAAHQQFKSHDTTDDAAIAELAGIEVHMVEGEASNRKITFPDDIPMPSSPLTTHNSQLTTRIGQGFDVHAFGDQAPKNGTIMLGGLAVASPRAILAHSDGDVVLHALVDALLGAIGEGDIGQHFPPSDPQWKGKDSSRFVDYTLGLMRKKGGAIGNVDITIIAETPKIGPHRGAMRKRVAELLEIDLERVNIKATTTEKLGFLGRGEGIAAQAIVALRVEN